MLMSTVRLTRDDADADGDGDEDHLLYSDYENVLKKTTIMMMMMTRRRQGKKVKQISHQLVRQVEPLNIPSRQRVLERT